MSDEREMTPDEARAYTHRLSREREDTICACGCDADHAQAAAAERWRTERDIAAHRARIDGMVSGAILFAPWEYDEGGF